MNILHLHFLVALGLWCLTLNAQKFDEGLKTFVATVAGTYKNATPTHITEITFFYRHMANMHPNDKIWLVMLEYSGATKVRTSFVSVEKKTELYSLDFFTLKNDSYVMSKWGESIKPNWRKFWDLAYDRIRTDTNCVRNVLAYGETGIYLSLWPQWPQCLNNNQRFLIYDAEVNCKGVIIKTPSGNFPYVKLFAQHPPNARFAPRGEACPAGCEP